MLVSPLPSGNHILAAPYNEILRSEIGQTHRQRRSSSAASEEIIMTDAEIQEFVTRFAAAWATRDAEAFLALWHPEGLLHHAILDRPLKGAELGRLVETQNELAPDLVWQLLDWTSRGDVVIVEWQNTRFIDGKRMAYRGVDKFRFRDGKIIEERVYMDTAPLRALRGGEPLKPIMRLE
jgi:ketosteroid isomerase-like protein